ncbi:MAG: excinuclease ABC subunit UvrC [Gammaproteobacteria bacterium]|nr:MAG: excinuclease ABC subunit UvrC [Gammaproteobacteria bacterium]
MNDATEQAEFDSDIFLKTLTSRPGVYRMLDENDNILYVGKARNLKKRVASYFRKSGLSPKNQVMMSHAHHIETTITNTEGEALILENNLIKSHKPRYNILLRDDKSYPYIYVATQDAFPRIAFHRGAKKKQGKYFGPYPSTAAVREAMAMTQKVFRIRQCEDSYFANRSRPCLQYQIKRCSAPCVGLVEAKAYQEDIDNVIMFLNGKSQQVIESLAHDMDNASQELDYEKAAVYRDQIARLKKIQEKQYISGDGGDVDVIASVCQSGISCVQVFMIRGGLNLGNKVFFPKHSNKATPEEVLNAFIPQYYIGKPVPPCIIVSAEPHDADLLVSALGEHTGHNIVIQHRVRGEKSRWLQMALRNAEHALGQHISSKVNMQRRYEALQEALNLEIIPHRLECFDISHTSGESTVASCVVFDDNGPCKTDYRRFNISNITPGDDYAAMEQSLSRRYKRIQEGEAVLPDILFIDGGRGQLSQAEKVFAALQVKGVTLVGVAKGERRRAGEEKLFLSGQKQPYILSANSPALLLIQQIRDEAHRFAVTGHRQRRNKTRRTSVLENISGLGPKRRQKLLRAFGGLQGITSAGIDDLSNIDGISRTLAERIYGMFHNDSD